MSSVTIIRTNGEREDHQVARKGGSLMRWVMQQIKAETTDAVNLRDGRMMLVDDNGWECESIDHGNGHFEIKPIRPETGKHINPEATKIYRAVCRPGTTHQIVGDVAIVLDEDFA